MGSPFQRAFRRNSPLNNHGKIQKKIIKARRKDGDNPDFYETYSHLYDAKAKAEAAHSNKADKGTFVPKKVEAKAAKSKKTKDTSQDIRIVEEERDNSRADASMSRKASPLDAVGAHSMTSDKYASHLASASEHKAPSDEVIAKRKKEGKKTTGHISDKQPTNTPPKDGMSRKASPFNHRDKTGKPIQGPKKHSHSTPIDTSNLSYFTNQAKINSKNTDAKKKAKEETKKALIERKNKAKK